MCMLCSLFCVVYVVVVDAFQQFRVGLGFDILQTFEKYPRMLAHKDLSGVGILSH